MSSSSGLFNIGQDLSVIAEGLGGSVEAEQEEPGVARVGLDAILLFAFGGAGPK